MGLRAGTGLEGAARGAGAGAASITGSAGVRGLVCDSVCVARMTFAALAAWVSRKVLSGTAEDVGVTGTDGRAAATTGAGTVGCFAGADTWIFVFGARTTTRARAVFAGFGADTTGADARGAACTGFAATGFAAIGFGGVIGTGILTVETASTDFLSSAMCTRWAAKLASAVRDSFRERAIFFVLVGLFKSRVYSDCAVLTASAACSARAAR